MTQSKNSKHLCIVAGKSGGHILPGQVIANNFVRFDKDCNVLFFTTDYKLDKLITHNSNNIKYSPLPISNFDRTKIYLYPIFFLQFLYSTFLSYIKLIQFKPSKVISMGGYLSLPVSLAAFILRVPIELFELNLVPGMAVKLLAPLANKISVCFEDTKKFFPSNKVEYKNYPLRFGQDDKLSKIQACSKLNIDPFKKIILILGGSQGSAFLNDCILDFINKNQKYLKNIHILHQVGMCDSMNVKKVYRDKNVSATVFNYCPEVNIHYSAADLVICRAGAGTLFELEFFEKKSIIIPLQTNTTDHQVDNAKIFTKLRPDLFVLFDQSDIEKNLDKFYTELISYINSID